MTVIPIKIPQLGEGLQEARLVEFLKQPGDRVERDECIFVMETDKAISEIEATDAGTLVEWTVDPDSVVPIGSEVGRLDVGDAAVVAGGGDSHG
jgi:pyruvate dehydrogenase E2 component (dihydrolipoamide acetyltransferase)